MVLLMCGLASIILTAVSAMLRRLPFSIIFFSRDTNAISKGVCRCSRVKFRLNFVEVIISYSAGLIVIVMILVTISCGRGCCSYLTAWGNIYCLELIRAFLPIGLLLRLFIVDRRCACNAVRRRKGVHFCRRNRGCFCHGCCSKL